MGIRYRYIGLRYYRLRRYHPERQFSALGRLGIGRSPRERAALLYGLGPWPVRPLDQAEQDSLDAYEYRLASYCACFGDALEHPACLLAGHCLRLNDAPRYFFRSNIARPLCFPSDPMHMLRASRQRPHALAAKLGKYAAWWHRPRTRFSYNRWRASYLHKRRSLARLARARGYEPIKPGLWYDRASDVVYCQSAVELEPIEQVQLKRA